MTIPTSVNWVAVKKGLVAPQESYIAAVGNQTITIAPRAVLDDKSPTGARRVYDYEIKRGGTFAWAWGQGDTLAECQDRALGVIFKV